jgi:hypothetical protein
MEMNEYKELKQFSDDLRKSVKEMLRTAEFQGSVADYASLLDEIANLMDLFRLRIIDLEKEISAYVRIIQIMKANDIGGYGRKNEVVM